jgi:hypothetical protein
MLEIRRGVLQITLHAPDQASNQAGLRLRTAWPTWLRQMALGWPELAHQLDHGEVQLTGGTPVDLMAFLDCFEKPAERMPWLATR